MGGEVGGWRLGRRPELDGLRGLAAIAVVVGHARIRGAYSAGAVGVGVFFVLSGFLITALLLEERERDGRIALGGFWRRRVVRLLPALAVVVAVAMWVPVFMFRPDWGDVAWIAAYLGNWRRAAGVSMSPLDHTWSLAIEEQFYVVWPLVVGAVLRWRPTWLLPVVAGLALTSVTLRFALWSGRDSVARVYFGTDTNAFLMLGGCLLAALLHQGERVEQARWVSWAALAGLVAVSGLLELWGPTAAIVRDPEWSYLLVPVATAALAVAVIARMVTVGWPLFRWSVLRWFGRLSYGLYLWHMLVIDVWIHWEIFGRFTEALFLAQVLAVSTALAWLSWVLIERPIIRRWRVARRLPAPDVDPGPAVGLEAGGGAAAGAGRRVVGGADSRPAG